MLCTVDVPWFLRVEGQRSCRSPSNSLHHVCQKSKPQLATKHGFFNGIDCAYIACRRPSISWFSEAKSKHTKLSTPGKIFTKVLSTFATLKKIQYLRQVVFKMSIFRKSDLPTMKSKRLEQILCLRKFYPYSHNFVCARLTKKKGCLLISGDRQLYM